MPRIVYLAIPTLFMMFRAMAHCLLWTIVLIYWQDTENRTQKQSQKWNYITWTLFYLLFCEAVDLLAARKSSCSLRFLYMCSKILKVKSWQKHNMNKECIEEKIWVVGKCFEDILKSTCIMNMHGKIFKKEERKNTKILQLYTPLFIRTLIQRCSAGAISCYPD